MAFLRSQKIRKFLLVLILLWGLFSFYISNPGNWLILAPVVLISALALVFIFTEISTVFLLLFLSFLSSYAFYIYLFQYNLPSWVVMVGIIIIFGFLFTYTEQKIGILGDKRLIYLLLFSILILEVFLTLSYFLVNPISQSIIVAATSYLFVGFCYTILAKHTDNKFVTYIMITLLVMISVFLTSGWGGSV